MKVLSAEETTRRLPYVELADAIEKVALSGEAQAPPRLVLPLPGGAALLVMPASDEDLAVTKLVTVHPGNAEHGRPTIQGEVVVMETATGRRLGILEGATVTARRTAALSLLAARTLASRPDGPLLILGAGVQARSHLEAFHEGLGVRDVFITSRTEAKAAALVAHAEGFGMRASFVADPADALEEAALIVTATTSRTPVLPSSVRDDAFIAAVGAFEPEAAELPPGLIQNSTVVVDTVDGARDEAGDLIQAHDANLFRWEDAAPLSEALRWTDRPKGPIVFESVGSALWDLAAARTAFGLDNTV